MLSSPKESIVLAKPHMEKQKEGLSRISEAPSENILDSRVIDERPNVNETVEKRKLISYNNPSLITRSAVSHTNFSQVA